jgi:hypothetical protein
VSDPYREEEIVQFRSFLPPLRELLEVCAQSVGKSIETADVEVARQIVARVMDTLEQLIGQTRSFLSRLDPPQPPGS